MARWRRRTLLLARGRQLDARAGRCARQSALRRGCRAWAARARARASDRAGAASDRARHRASRLLAAWLAWRVHGARLHRSALLAGATGARGARRRLRRGVAALRGACRAARWAPRHMARYRLRTAMQAWLDAACDFAQGGGLAVVAAAAACLGARSRVAAAWAQWRAWQAAAPSASRRWQQRASHELEISADLRRREIGISADLETSPGQPLGSELALCYLPLELACLRLRLKHAWPRWARECRLWRCRHAAAVAVAQQRSTRRLAAALWAWALRTEARSLTLATAQLCQRLGLGFGLGSGLP